VPIRTRTDGPERLSPDVAGIDTPAALTTPSPRLLVAGTAGDAGKTLVTLSILAALRQQGLSPAAFKKGPDYIDAAWLGWAAGSSCRNLDTYLQPREALLQSFRRHASAGVNVIEGNRGLHDGADAAGTHSSASLARMLEAPVVLVVPCAKVTRTAAAVVLGCQQLDPEVRVAGVVLNRVRGARHERVLRQAVEQVAGVPVVGVLPNLPASTELLPDRHLGLVPPQEREGIEALEQELLRVAREHLDLEQLLALAREAPALAAAAPENPRQASTTRVGVFQDSAFTFYYPENLEALEQAGAQLVPISGLADSELPAVDALYLGGGFPETHAPQLAANTALHGALREAVEAGMPVYAECGGLIYLSRRLHVDGGASHAMSGVLPLELELHRRPQGHGYVELQVDAENPFFEPGQTLRGHEFHYTALRQCPDGPPPTAFAVTRGTGAIDGRDGIVYKNVVAGYTHLHALGAPSWAPALVDAARRWRDGPRAAKNGNVREHAFVE
jgi:cobyrinic acid a,c-diamide synthase